MSVATRWGLTVPLPGLPLADHLEVYRRAEALGYDDLWSSETPNGADGFSTLATAIPVTERMRLVTGIVNPYTRGPAVLAQTAATLQEASGGRFALGLGSSSNVVVERFNGLEFDKPYSRMRAAVQQLRPVLSVPAEKGFGGLRLERPVTTPVPIIVAALRERMLGMAGELADGAFTNFLPLSGLAQVAAAHRAGEESAGREPGSSELACRLFIIPDASDQGAALARMLFTNYASVPVYTEFFRWLGWGERLDPMVAAYQAGDRARALELASEEMISDIFLFGSIEAIREKLDRFIAGGITTVVINPIVEAARWAEVIEALGPRG